MTNQEKERTGRRPVPWPAQSPEPSSPEQGHALMRQPAPNQSAAPPSSLGAQRPPGESSPGRTCHRRPALAGPPQASRPPPPRSMGCPPRTAHPACPCLPDNRDSARGVSALHSAKLPLGRSTHKPPPIGKPRFARKATARTENRRPRLVRVGQRGRIHHRPLQPRQPGTFRCHLLDHLCGAESAA